GEDLAPLSKGLVGGDEGSPLVPGADEFKEHAGFGLVFGDVGEVIEDQEVEFVELGNGGFESELATGDLQSLNEICGAGEQHAPAVFDKSEAERAPSTCQVGSAGCRRLAGRCRFIANPCYRFPPRPGIFGSWKLYGP